MKAWRRLLVLVALATIMLVLQCGMLLQRSNVRTIEVGGVPTASSSANDANVLQRLLRAAVGGGEADSARAAMAAAAAAAAAARNGSAKQCSAEAD